MAIVLQRTHRSCVPTEVVSVRPWCHSVTCKVRYVPSRDARSVRPSPNQRDYAVTFVLQRTHRSCVPTEVVSVRPWCHSITRKVRYVPSRDARSVRPSLSKATASITCVPTEVVSVCPWCHSVTCKVRYVPSRDARSVRPSLSKATASITCVPTEVVSVRPWCHSITRKVCYVPSRDARKYLVGGRPSPSKVIASITCVPTTVIRRLVLQRTHRSCVPTGAVWVRPYRSRPGASPRRPAVGCWLEKIQRWLVTII